jgi:hypothetical protein
MAFRLLLILPSSVIGPRLLTSFRRRLVVRADRVQILLLVRDAIRSLRKVAV